MYFKINKYNQLDFKLCDPLNFYKRLDEFDSSFFQMDKLDPTH